MKKPNIFWLCTDQQRFDTITALGNEYIQTPNKDTIGFSAYGWDLPDPKRPSHQPMHEVNRHIGDHTPIPFCVMVPRPLENVICPGRAISVERDVLGPLREQAPCIAMGQAAGLLPCKSCARTWRSKP